MKTSLQLRATCHPKYVNDSQARVGNGFFCSNLFFLRSFSSTVAQSRQPGKHTQRASLRIRRNPSNRRLFAIKQCSEELTRIGSKGEFQVSCCLDFDTSKE